jgi:hypothetical protein
MKKGQTSQDLPFNNTIHQNVKVLSPKYYKFYRTEIGIYVMKSSWNYNSLGITFVPYIASSECSFYLIT